MSEISDSRDFSWFSEIEELPQNELYSTAQQFNDDDYNYKLDLAFPCYRGENGKPWVLPVVRTAEVVIAKDDSLTKEYLHAFGYKSFNNSAITLLLACTGRTTVRCLEATDLIRVALASVSCVALEAQFLPLIDRSTQISTIYTGQCNNEEAESSGFIKHLSSITKDACGENSSARIENRAFAVQTISATGAVRTGAEFMVQSLGMKTIYSTQQTIEYMDKIFLAAGFTEYRELRYFNYHYLTLDNQGMLQDLAQAKERSAVILQVSGHNPTGYDPSLADWDQIADIVVARKLFPFFYCLYQGFATGDTDQDVAPVRMFEQRGIEFICAQSFAWNFGLYNERVGCLSICLNSAEKVSPIKSHLITIIKNMYSTPPSYGARIIALILGDRMLSEQWKDTLEAVVGRLKRMRMYLREELERLGAPGTWQHITNQVGNFCLTGLSEIQVEHLKKQYHIYLLSNGRLNVSGLNPDNVEYVAKAIYETLSVIPSGYIM